MHAFRQHFVAPQWLALGYGTSHLFVNGINQPVATEPELYGPFLTAVFNRIGSMISFQVAAAIRVFIRPGDGPAHQGLNRRLERRKYRCAALLFGDGIEVKQDRIKPVNPEIVTVVDMLGIEIGFPVPSDINFFKMSVGQTYLGRSPLH